MDYILAIIELAMMVLLFIVAKVAVKYVSNKWRLLYTAPTLVMIVMLLCEGFDVHYIGFYAGAVLQLIGLFMGNDSSDKRFVRSKQILVGCSAALIVVSLVLISFSRGYHRLVFYSDFEKAFSVMKEHYVLTEEKGINWDELYAKYKPLFKEVDRDQDHVENYKLWRQFCGEFYDGHVGYNFADEGKGRDAFCRAYGNDYGLSLAKLSTGEYVAVNVEGYDNSYTIDNDTHDDIGYYMVKDKFISKTAEVDRLTLKNAGIKNGTVITRWNGRPIDEYFEKVRYYMEQYPVRENEEFYLPMYVAGIGEDMEYGETYVPGEVLKSKNGTVHDTAPTASVTYLNEAGQEETVSAPSLGIYTMRLLDTIEKIDQGVNITNLKWQKVNDTTYMIRISQMIYNQETYSGTDYTEMEETLRKELADLKSQGVKNIIFDLRSNGGGSPYFVQSIAKLFAPEGEHVSYYSAVINEDTATYERGEDGRYTKGAPNIYQGEDLWSDGNVILLVNALTVSAGDDMTYMMGEYPNVKVIGFTRTNSSCQAIHQEDLEIGALTFSAVPNLEENGDVMIDTKTDHVGRTPFDEKIPFDQEAITAIFDSGEDYLLKYTADSF
ncbi:MAG: hypothetical protein IKS48_04870 [Eubacterium sp.]|nr:hypothetical protein [Eubacterium sp.]